MNYPNYPLSKTGNILVRQRALTERQADIYMAALRREGFRASKFPPAKRMDDGEIVREQWTVIGVIEDPICTD